MTSSNVWAVEYSHSQNTFHLGKTVDMLRRNINSVYQGDLMDYICVGIFATKEQAMNAMLDFKRNRITGHTFSLLI